MQDKKLAINLLKESINKFVKCEDCYKYLKSEKTTYTISLENRNCTCVKFEKFSMCHHLVAIAMAEGKELRGLDLSKVLVSKQRRKINKKNKEFELDESMLEILEDDKNDEIEKEAFQLPQLPQQQQSEKVSLTQPIISTDDVVIEQFELPQQSHQQSEVLLIQPKKKRGRPPGSKKKATVSSTQTLQVPQFLHKSYRGQLLSAKSALDRY